jgi:uncharacterized protein
MVEADVDVGKVMPKFDLKFTVQDYLDKMDAVGIQTVILTPKSGENVKVSVEKLKKIIDKHPDRFAGVVSVGESSEGLDNIETAIKEHSFKGVSLSPHYLEKSPSDKSFYPIYEKCVELDVPIMIKVGAVWQPNLRSSVCHPSYLEDVAIDFPELKIVGFHVGWPWTDEMILLAWKFKNVFIAASNHYPKSSWIGDFPTSCWDPSLIGFINSGRGCTAYLQEAQVPWKGMDKVLFASTFPAFDPSIIIDEMKQVLNAEAFVKVSRQNATKVFGF